MTYCIACGRNYMIDGHLIGCPWNNFVSNKDSETTIDYLSYFIDNEAEDKDETIDFQRK